MENLIIYNTIIKQYKTGGYKSSKNLNNFFFTVWEIPLNTDEETIERIIEKAKEKNVDFVLEQKNEELEYLHVSYLYYKNKIIENGLVFNEENEWVNDLGEGIYLIEKGDEVALDNLKNYVENHEDEKLILVTGSYKGYYLECIYGYEHEGYICVKENIKSDDLDIEVFYTEDFLLYK